MINKVISGGQIGADIAAVRAAFNYGILTGGWMPKTYRTAFGHLGPNLVRRYNFKEHESRDYPKRTRDNVEGSDGTMRFAYNFQTRGEKCTMKYIKLFGRPHLDIAVYRGMDDELIDHGVRKAVLWINHHNIKTLNVAGNALNSIEPFVEDFLTRLFTALDKQ